MRQLSIPRIHLNENRSICVLLALVLLMVTASYGQALGDVARDQRKKQAAKDTHAPRKVITDEDMPEHAESAPSPSPSTSGGDGERGDSSFHPAAQVAQSGEQWKAAIQAQKNSVADLQRQVDQLNASIHFVEANRYTNGVQYNQYQAKKQQESQRIQKRLDGEKKKLADMQEAARRQGFGSVVYEP
jgi:hypothetical protein